MTTEKAERLERELRFTGAVSIGSEEGRSIVLATRLRQVWLTVPVVPDHASDGSDTTLLLSTEEAWCLAQQLLLAVRRAER